MKCNSLHNLTHLILEANIKIMVNPYYQMKNWIQFHVFCAFSSSHPFCVFSCVFYQTISS